MSNFKIFIYEIKNVFKQVIIFTCISVFLFSLTIGILCFSLDMMDSYKQYLNKNFDVISLSMYDVKDIQAYENINKLGDALCASVQGVTYYPNLKYGQNVVNCLGTSYIFTDKLPFQYNHCTFRGRSWCAKDNTATEGIYPIFLSQTIADELSIEIGDNISFEFTNNIGNLMTCNMRVTGIYSEEEGVYDDFVIPFSFILNHANELVEPISFHLELQCPSDVVDVYPKLQKLGLDCNSVYISVEEISLVNSMRYILIAISVAVLVITFFVLNSSLTITMNTRKKFMAKLKLLGATTDNVSLIYYIVLLLSFLVAFIISILLSYYFCGYFTYVAKSVLEYPIKISLHWEACVGLFGGGCLLLVLRYFLFRKKIKVIAPLAFIKEE